MRSPTRSALDADGQRMRQMLAREVAPQVQRLHVGGLQLSLPRYCSPISAR
jgi:hypothetical protein